MKMRYLWSAVLLLALCPSAWGQTAKLSGSITDSSGAAIPSAHVTALNKDRGTERKTSSNTQGQYSVPGLLPGVYMVKVDAKGFATVTRDSVTLSVDQSVRLDFVLKVGTVKTSVVVPGNVPLVNPTGGGVGTVIDPNFVTNMPLNGRSFTALLSLVPGVVPTSDPRMFDVNGQRGLSNSFSIDGVSANIGGALAPNQVGGYNAGTALGVTASGTTQATANMDELQEFSVQTAGYSAKYGSYSGAQVSFDTKSGTNHFHGSLFEFVRNEKLDANDWFLNHTNPPTPRPKLRQNDAGGTFGGPIFKNKTFFFFALEFDPLLQPAAGQLTVPTQAYRNAADPALKPLLDWFPLPNGTIQPNVMAGIYIVNQSDPSFVDALSLRLDQRLGSRVSVFARYHRAPSRLAALGSEVSDADTWYTNTQTGTFGATATLSPRIVNQFRFNYDRASSGRHEVFNSMGGSVQPPDSALFPPGLNQANAAVLAHVADNAAGVSSGFAYEGQSSRTVQHQWQITDDLSLLRGKHQFDFGVDWRRLSPSIQQANDTLVLAVANGAAGQVQIVTLGLNSGAFSMHSTSLYAQDSWRTTPRLTLDLGLRWDVEPPPSEISGPPLFAAEHFDPNNPAALTLAPIGTPPWKTRYGNFAPRLGFAYELFNSPGRETVLRGAFGLYYDSDIGMPFNYLTNSLFGSFVTGAYPGVLASATLQPPPFQVNPPYQILFVSDPHLHTPYTMNWNFGIQQALGESQAFSLDYVGNRGESLVMAVNQNYTGNPIMTTSGSIQQTTNQGRSWYDALEAQFNRRLSTGLATLVNYTWSHSIDLASVNGAVPGIATPGGVASVNLNKASSDFDVRQAFTAALTYSIPAPFANRALRAVAGGWSLDPLARAYSAKPINVVYQYEPNFTYSYYLYPNRVPGQPLWISDPTVGGGRRINPAAFSVPTFPSPSQIVQGDLGRNALRGFPAWQADFALRREFGLSERFKLLFSGEIFNIFNHPNFANPYGSLGYYAFGQFHSSGAVQYQSPGMLSQQGGSYGVGSDTLPVLAFGGQRDVQLSLKLTF